MRTVLYGVWLLFVIAAAVSMVRAARRAQRQQRRMRDWPRVPAVVTGARQGWTGAFGGGNRNVRYWPTYEFTDPAGRPRTGESEVSDVREPVPGRALEVVHNPADPAESYEVTTQDRAVLGCLVPFFVVLLAVALWFISVFPLP